MMSSSVYFVPFQIGADTGSLRGGVDVEGIGFNHEALANKNSRPSMLSTKMSIISANLATVSSCPPLVEYACSAVMKRSHVFNFFFALLQRNSDPFTCTYIQLSSYCHGCPRVSLDIQRCPYRAVYP